MGLLSLQPFTHVVGQFAPRRLVVDHPPHPLGEIGRQREFRAAPAGDLRVRRARPRDEDVHPRDPLEPPHLAAEQEGVAGDQALNIPFLDLADLAPRPTASPAQADVQHRRAHDGAAVEPVAEGGARVPHLPQTVPTQDDAAEMVVGLQGVTASGDERQHLVELGSGEVGIGLRGRNLRIEIIRRERFAAGAAHDVLGQDIKRAVAHGIAVQGVLGHRLARGLALQHLEPVGRHQQGAGRLVQGVVGPANPLNEAGRALRRRQLDHQVDIAPVDAQVQGRGADHGLELTPRHRRLHLAPLFGGQGAVVQGDGQIVVVEPPEFLKRKLRLPAGVDKDQGGLGPADHVIDLGHGVLGGVARPGHARARQQDVNHRRRPGLAHDQVRHPGRRAQPAPQPLRVVHRRRQPHPAQIGRELGQSGEAHGEQIAALGGVDGVDLVDHHMPQVLEIEPRALPGAEQGQLFGGGQQYVGRIEPLTLALGHAHVPGARLHRDRQRHLADGGGEVALDVRGQGLQGRDIEGVHPTRGIGRRPLGQLDQTGQKPGQGLAPAGGGDQQGVTAGAGLLHHP